MKKFVALVALLAVVTVVGCDSKPSTGSTKVTVSTATK